MLAGSDDADLHNLVVNRACGRSGLRHPGDRDSVELLLHHRFGLGDFLPLLLLLLGPGLVIMQQHMEYRQELHPKNTFPQLCFDNSDPPTPLPRSENCMEFLRANDSVNHTTNPNATSPVMEFWE